MESSPADPIKKRSRFRILKVFSPILLSTLLLVASSAFIVSVFYEKEVKNYIISQLNLQLKTKILIEPNDIHLSLLKDFPYASLRFENVTALDAIPGEKKDTLFNAGSIALQFNVMDIFRKNYRIRKVEIEHVQLNIRVDKKGNDNYHFWKSSEASQDTSSFSFALDKFHFKDVTVNYDYRPSRYLSSFTIDNAVFSGNFKGEKFDLEADLSANVNFLKIDSITYLDNKPVQLSMHLKAGQPEGSYEITDGNLKLAELEVKANGKINDKDINLKISGKDLDITSVLSLLPSKYTEDIRDFESKGIFYFESTLKGPYRNNSEPIFSGSFGIKNGTIVQKTGNVQLVNVLASGSFLNSRPSESFIELNNFSANLSGGNIKGSFRVKNFKEPFLYAAAEAEVDLVKLQEFLRIDTVESMLGHMVLNATLKGDLKRLKNFNKTGGNASEFGAAGLLDLSNATIRIKKSMVNLDSLNTKMELSDNNIAVEFLKGYIAGSDFYFKGDFNNVLPYVFSQNQPLSVSASFRSVNFSLDSLLSTSTSSSKQESYNLKIGDNVNAVLKTNIDHLKFRKFDASDLSGTLTFKDNKMTAENLAFSTMDGKVEASGTIDVANQKQILSSCETKLSNINITKLFYQLENFGQEVLQDKNVKGRISANIQFAAVMDSSLNIDMNKIYSRSDVSIENGELMQFGPFRELGDYIKKDKILRMFIEADEFSKKLEHIKFTTLKNNIEVKNRLVIIPAMEIKSSAMNIEFSGTHNFENLVNYKFNFFLSEIFTKKQKRIANSELLRMTDQKEWFSSV
jgi:hypothetical protein